jgi:hypothetical protein
VSVATARVPSVVGISSDIGVVTVRDEVPSRHPTMNTNMMPNVSLLAWAVALDGGAVDSVRRSG